MFSLFNCYRLLRIKIWIIMVFISASSYAFAGEPVVLVFIIDGLQRDAAQVAITNGAVNLKYLVDKGVCVNEAYCTSPAPRMYLPDGSLPWGTSSSPNVAMHTGTHVFESRQMDDIFLSARRAGIKSVFAGGAINYEEFTTPDFTYAGSLTDAEVVQHGIDHLKNDGVRLLRLHLQQIRRAWTGPEGKFDRTSSYQKHLLYADSLLGVVIQELKSEGLWNNTFIIVAGDHGMGITSESDHPPSVHSSWLTFMNFYGPGIKKGATIPYAETPDMALVVNHLLRLDPLKGHTDVNINIERRGPTAKLLTNIFEGSPDEIAHPGMIKRYLESKNFKPSDDFSEYRLSMLRFIEELAEETGEYYPHSRK
jgi:hypothetical protein